MSDEDIRFVEGENEKTKVKKVVKLPTWLTDDEIARFFGVINDPKHTLMFKCIYYLGLRVSEIINCTQDDFNLREGVFTVQAATAKTKRERRIPIPKPLALIIKSYLALTGSDMPVFNLSRERIWQLTKKYASKAGLAKNVHPHTLRHSYATLIYQKTGDLKLVQELLGHSSLSTTSIYAHLDDQSKRRGIEGVF